MITRAKSCIYVTDKHEANEIYEKFDHVLSITNVGAAPTFKHPSHLHVQFNDTLLEAGEIPMNTIATIIDWYGVVCCPLDSVLVHCDGGISRSTAVAIGLKIANGLDVESAYNDVIEQRLCAWPNSDVLKIFDDLLCLGGELVRMDDHWKTINKGLNKTIVRMEDWKAAKCTKKVDS